MRRYWNKYVNDDDDDDEDTNISEKRTDLPSRSKQIPNYWYFGAF